MFGDKPSRVDLRFQLTKPGSLADDWQRFFNVTAAFQFVAAERAVYSESEFPVIELASAPDSWLGSLDRGMARDCVFPSIDSATGRLIRFTQVGDLGFIASALACAVSSVAFATKERTRAARANVLVVCASVQQWHGFEPRALSVWAAAQQLAEALDNRRDLRLTRPAGPWGGGLGPQSSARIAGELSASAGQPSSRPSGGSAITNEMAFSRSQSRVTQQEGRPQCPSKRT
jgi:hypothetical protein